MAHVSWRYECIADMTLLFISLKGMLGLCTYMSDKKILVKIFSFRMKFPDFVIFGFFLC